MIVFKLDKLSRQRLGKLKVKYFRTTVILGFEACKLLEVIGYCSMSHRFLSYLGSLAFSFKQVLLVVLKVILFSVEILGNSELTCSGYVCMFRASSGCEFSQSVSV